MSEVGTILRLVLQVPGEQPHTIVTPSGSHLLQEAFILHRGAIYCEKAFIPLLVRWLSSMFLEEVPTLLCSTRKIYGRPTFHEVDIYPLLYDL